MQQAGRYAALGLVLSVACVVAVSLLPGVELDAWPTAAYAGAGGALGGAVYGARQPRE